MRSNNAVGRSGNKRGRQTPGNEVRFMSPGVNSTLIYESNLASQSTPLMNTRDAGSNVDTKQNVIGNTTLSCPPPLHRNINDPSVKYICDDTERSPLFAPRSEHPAANTPQRHEWAFSAPFNREWTSLYGEAVTEGTSYAACIPVFTNFGGVDSSTEL